MHELLKDLTIVVPTKNRPLWLLRVFKYYSEYNFQGKILIADSSDERLLSQIKKQVHKFQNLNIKILHYPDLNCESAIYSASKNIVTSYSVFLADDDIILLGGLIEAVNFLKKNKTYVGAVGKSFMFGTINGSPFGKINSVIDYNLRSYDNEDSYKRIEDYFSDIKALCFAVVKTEVFKKSYEIIISLEKLYQTFILGENLQAICYLTEGKIIKLENEYLIRQFHSANNYHNINKTKWLKNTD